MLSIITINYNNYLGLERTIKSVLFQTNMNYEFIIIDGGSTDGSVEVIKKYEEMISYWISEQDHGIYHAMNKGVIHAHGDYCVFMNSGDCFYDEHVLDNVFNDVNAEDVIVGKVSIDNKDSIISPPPLQNELTLYHLYSGAIPHQGAFIKTELLRKYPYDENLRISSDWKFFVQVLIMDNCSIRYLDKFVARYDLNGISASNPELMREEKESVLAGMFPPRVLADYKRMKQSECMMQTLTPQLKMNYRIDRFLYKIGVRLLKLKENLS